MSTEADSVSTPLDTDKYDRQIRLFGLDTQKTLQSCSVAILGAANLASAEVLKNLVLLGVKNIQVADEIVKECRRIVPDDLEEINGHVSIRGNQADTVDFAFLIDHCDRPETAFYSICTKCRSIKKNSPCHGPGGEACKMEDKAASPEIHCLLGSIAVQEFLKHIQRRDSILEYKLNL